VPEAVAAVMREARERTGLHDFGDDWFLGPLETWVAASSSEEISDAGRRMMVAAARSCLVRRLEVLDLLRRHPEISEVPIPPIVYVTGLARSGTTLLHNLLAMHERTRALLRWELLHPVPPPTPSSYGSDERIERVQRVVERNRGTVLEHMHFVQARDPEECVFGFIDPVFLLGGAHGIESVAELETAGDLTPALRHYRSVLQVLLWKHPLAPGGALVLKAPQLGPQVAALAEVLPEAKFVMTDRDPYRTIVSGLFLISPMIDAMRAVPIDRRWLAAQAVEHLCARSLAAIESFTEEHPGRILHVRYPDLVREPGAVAEAALSWAGVSPDGALGSRIDSYLAAQRTGGRATPPADLDPDGLIDPAWVRGHPVIGRYIARFGIEPEAVRLTGA
jgi:hypothetical protein